MGESRNYLVAFLAAAAVALLAGAATLLAVCRLASAISDSCLAIEVIWSKALFEALSIDCMVAANTSPPTGAAD